MYQFVENYPEWPKKDIVKHFMDEKVSKWTIYDILQRIEKYKPPERKSTKYPAHWKMKKES